MKVYQHNLAVILPAFNEAPVIKKTIQALKKFLAANKIAYKIIVVDDGSSDNTAHQAAQADYLIRHRLNRGLGAALATGLEFVKRNGQFQTAITFDSDGQHYPADIIKALAKLNQGFDLVIGSRFLDRRNKIPVVRKLILKLSNLITFLFFGVVTTDSQSGFRAFNQTAIKAIHLSTNRMEVSSEFFAEIKLKKLTFAEIPIKVKYSQYSLRKGQTNFNSFKVVVKLIIKLFR